MLPLFSDQGRSRLEQIAQPGVLCVFDFDGTLSPIVPQADQAKLPAAIRSRLIRLTEITTTAVITGRALPDIRQRLRFEPDYVLGNHGMEGLPGWERQAAAYRDICQAWNQRLQNTLRNTSFDANISVEYKEYSLSLHYRLTENPEETGKALSRMLHEEFREARIIPGKCVFNLLPRGAESKGTALEKLLQLSGADHAIYLGDDVTDEDIFALDHPGLLGIRVGHWAESAADYYLDSHESMAPFLDLLTERLLAKQTQGAMASQGKG